MRTNRYRVVRSVAACTFLGATIVMRRASAQSDSTPIDAGNRVPACADCIRVPPPGSAISIVGAAQDTTRHRAIEYSDAYYTRLTIHRIGSYVELPLFATEFILGEKLLTEENNGTLPKRSSLATVHSTVAGGLGVLFTVNTVTGVWNLIESRHNPEGRTQRWIHSLAMLAADGGFFWTASVAGGAKRTDAGAAQHRNIAIASMSLATASTLMMWFWKR
jgi:hypothetical protein